MKDVVFITGNQSKADYLSKYLGHPVEHIKMELDEIQSLDIRAVVEHKVRQAYEKIQRPVLVEDSGIEFTALGRLPGTFTRFFHDELGLEAMCRLIDGKTRECVTRCVFGYFDGDTITFIEGELAGTVAEHPKGAGGFGFDPIFIPEGYTQTRSEMNEQDDRDTYVKAKPFAKVKEYLQSPELTQVI